MHKTPRNKLTFEACLQLSSTKDESDFRLLSFNWFLNINKKVTLYSTVCYRIGPQVDILWKSNMSNKNVKNSPTQMSTSISCTLAGFFVSVLNVKELKRHHGPKFLLYISFGFLPILFDLNWHFFHRLEQLTLSFIKHFGYLFCSI